MRRLSIRSAFALVDQDLRPLRDGVVDVSDGVVTGIGRVPGSNNVVDLGNAILMPQLTNAHIHVLDHFLMGLFNKFYIDDLVGAPYGLKYQYLRRVNPESLRGGLARLFRRIRGYGVGCLLAIIEYGMRFVDVVLEEAGRVGLCVVPLAEPSVFRVYVHPNEEEDVDEVFEEEVRYFVERGFGISLISPLNYSTAELMLASRLGGSRNLLISTHVSETVDTHADGDLSRALSTLVTGNSLFVHMTQLSDDEIAKLPKVSVAVCPRSNVELVGRLPSVGSMVRVGLKPMVGTDNTALIEPDPWGELRFMRYAMAGGQGLRPIDILMMSTSWAWSWGFGYIIREGLPMRGLAVGVAYESLDADYVHDYLLTRVSSRDILYLIDGQDVVKVI
ncbi:MAG: amidohydrolase family protein [Vulcanisaeta sp. AZ3]|jgi:cytosine/adenosine deaminase-related metal-dependent hydrolase|nr:MAG: amidohydrolase [Vulcanisaeta sp. AZ3]